MTIVSLSADPILAFYDSAGAPLVGGTLLTQVSGTAYPTYSDAAGTIPLPNPITLNSRGEIATASGISTPMFVVPSVAYTYTLSDALGNTIWTSPNITSPPNLAAILASLTQQVLGFILYPLTGPEGLAAITPSNFGYAEGDIRRYGATVGSSNNAPAFNSACAVSDQGGNAVFIPGGTWAITSTINAIGSCSMYGVGNASIIAPATNSVDGITLGQQDFILGSRFFRDFQILGPSATTSTANGFNAAGTNTVASGGRNTGIQFSDLSIQNFQVGILCRQLWQSTFTNNFLYNNATGYYFHGQNIVINVNGGFVQRGTITAVGTDYGIFADIAAGTETVESLHVTGVGLYGYSYNISMQIVLYSAIENCDLSLATINGIQIIGNHGGCAIRDTWIQMAPGSVNPIAINLTDLGAHLADKIVIDNCTLIGNTTVLQPNSIGVYVGAANDGVSVTNCTIGNAQGPFAYGVKNGFGANAISQNNTIFSSAPSGSYDNYVNSSTGNCTIGPNVSQNSGGSPPAVLLGFTGVTPPGLALNASGSFTGTLTGMTATITGIITWVAQGGLVYLSPPNAGITGTSNATTMTMTGLPTYLIPNANRQAMARTIDSGTTTYGTANVATTGVITFFKDANATAFTNTGTKGLNPTSLIYALG